MINRLDRHHQSGLVLLTSLVLLLLLSLLATASARLINLNGLLANQQQSFSLTQQLAQNMINELLTDSRYFIDQKTAIDPAQLQALVSVDQSGPVTGEVISISCVAENRLNGCSIDAGGQCASRYYWELTVRATHESSFTQAEITQGFSFDYLSGYCPQ